MSLIHHREAISLPELQSCTFTSLLKDQTRGTSAAWKWSWSELQSNVEKNVICVQWKWYVIIWLCSIVQYHYFFKVVLIYILHWSVVWSCFGCGLQTCAFVVFVLAYLLLSLGFNNQYAGVRATVNQWQRTEIRRFSRFKPDFLTNCWLVQHISPETFQPIPIKTKFHPGIFMVLLWSFHFFLVRLMSALWIGHSETLRFFFFKHTFFICVLMCIDPLSLKMQFIKISIVPFRDGKQSWPKCSQTDTGYDTTTSMFHIWD